MNIEKLTETCLHCKKKPCKYGCPLRNEIPGLIKLLKENKYKESFDLLSKTTLLPAICGLVCPTEDQCIGHCVKKFSKDCVKINEIEYFIANYALNKKWKIPSPKKTKYHCLVIGGGPAGLTCAGFLRRNGIRVTIIEKHNYLGGILTHGIPEFRLPKELVNKTIENILNLGVDVIYNKELGKDFLIEDVINKYDAIFLGIGKNNSNLLNIEGENLNGVFGGNEFLEQNLKLDIKNKTVVVIGGGNVSLDVARTIIRNKPKDVIITYRKNEESMPVSPDEYADAKKEGVKFLFQTNVIKIIGKDKVQKVEYVKTDILDNNLVSNIENSNKIINCDYVIKTIGSHASEKILNSLPLTITKKNTIAINKDGRTTNPKIFAGGDVAGVKSTVAWASRSGRNAAYQIIKYLKES